jgi:mono/diheme cytochrome c family protein
MKNVRNLAIALVIVGAVSSACSSSDDSSSGSPGGGGGTSSGGHAGSAGASGGSAGKTNSAGSSGVTSGGSSTGGTSGGGSSTGGSNIGGSNIGNAGAAVGGASSAGEAGTGSDEGGAAGASSAYSVEQVARGTEIVRSIALCGGCHTATNGMELGGNPTFKNSTLPAPNLTPDPTGIGTWTDAQIMNAFRNGINGAGRHLDPTMPYWLFHNMSDAEALAVVAFLRSLPAVSAAVGTANPDVAAVTPLAPSAFPDSSLQPADANYAAAQQGKYLVSGISQCVKCHSPATSGLPSGSFFSGVAPTSGTQIFAPNITPDASGINGWTATDVATALKAGTNKAGTTLCGSMPSASKGYGGMSDADAQAIGVYLTTIPAVANTAAAAALEPACP